MSQPPQYYNGMILGATCGGDSGFPCLVFALNANTGKVLWKFHLIPNKPSEPGYSTWSHPLTFDGGAAEWSQIGVDPSLGLVYASIGNPIPYGGEPSAARARSGSPRRARVEPQDRQDGLVLPGGAPRQLGRRPVAAGHARELPRRRLKKAIIAANKDGLWYVLNRATGKPIIPVKETAGAAEHHRQHLRDAAHPGDDAARTAERARSRPSWKGLTGADGKPYDIGNGGPAGSFVAITPNQYSVTAAFGQGASGNKPASIDPTSDTLVEETTPGFSTFEALPLSEVAKLSYLNFNAVLNLKIGSLKGTPAAAVSGTQLEAMDIKTGKMLWMVDRINPTSAAAAKKAQPIGGGVVTTPGIVWTNGGNHLQAFSETNGKLLWSSPALATTSTSPPTVYGIGNTEYVTLFDASTGDLYAFSVTGTGPA